MTKNPRPESADFVPVPTGEVASMDRSVESLSARVLLLQILAHAVIFAAQNAGNLAERALLAADTAATAALGLSGTAFCLLTAFTTNVVNVGQLVAGRRTGRGDEPGARAVARQALILAGGGGVLGVVIAAVAGTAAVFASGPVRDAALFLGAQGLALGPNLGAAALIGYFAGTMRVGPGLLAAVSAVPIAVQLVLVWLLTGLLAWSVAGAGLARLGAAVAVAAGALAVAGGEVRQLVRSVRRPDRALLRAMVAEGSVLGLQQVVAGLMVLLLYFRAAGAGDVTSAALTLAHSGVYPLLFAFAWGSSQAVGAAAALAVGRGDARDFARATWLGLSLAAALAFALPWGLFALCGPAALAWLVEGSPTGGAVHAVSVRVMGALAVFFVFDFAINYLSALLRAVKEQVYLLKVTAAVAAGFGVLVLALPMPADVVYLLGTFITAQAVWALLLLARVVTRWPGAPGRMLAAAPYFVRKLNASSCLPASRFAWEGEEEGTSAIRVPARLSKRRGPVTEHPAMNPFDPNTGRLPPTLRALAMGLVVDAAVPTLNQPRPEALGPAGPGEGGADGKTASWQDLRWKCDELLAVVLRADDPEKAAAFVLGYLPKHFEYIFELLCGRKRERVI
jgi:Na+-driven multidrug efflux pump